MSPLKSLDHDKLRAVLSDDRFEWRKHVLQRLAERGIRQASVVEVLLSGERIEDYPDDRSYPSALFFGWAEGKPLHATSRPLTKRTSGRTLSRSTSQTWSISRQIIRPGGKAHQRVAHKRSVPGLWWEEDGWKNHIQCRSRLWRRCCPQRAGHRMPPVWRRVDWRRDR